MKKRESIIEKLVGSEAKAELLMLFHQNPHLTCTLEVLAAKLGKRFEETEKDIGEFVNLGLIKETKIYSFDQEKDKELQHLILSQMDEDAFLGVTDEVTRQGSRTGVELIDYLISEGIPPSANMLILGPPGTGKTLLCQQLVSEALISGKPVVYINLDDFAESIKNTIKMLGADTKHYENENMFCFIDCYSYQIEAKSNEKYVVDPRSLTNLSIEVSKALSSFQGSKPLLIIDSLSTLIHNCEIRSTIDFLRMLVAKIRKHGSNCFIKLNSQAFHTAIIAAIQDLVDGIIETEGREETSGLSHYIRIKKMSGIKHSTSKIRYDIHPQQGLVRKLG